jgi:hypothetical protein
MIWGDSVKELEIRLIHWEREIKNYGLHINLEKTITLRLSRMENTIMKKSRSEIR